MNKEILLRRINTSLNRLKSTRTMDPSSAELIIDFVINDLEILKENLE